MLEIKNIKKTFNPGTVNEKVALDGLSLTINDGGRRYCLGEVFEIRLHIEFV